MPPPSAPKLVAADATGLLKPVTPAEFAGWMVRLGPFEPAPVVAVAVSGGADSLAAALLTRDWARARAGTVLGLVVDHGLRRESADEAVWVCAQLRHLGIAAVTLTVMGLVPGPGLAARARAARHAALETACAERGILHLVFGHHALDQAETMAMRLLRQSGPDGLAGMAALTETAQIRRLRPLLAVPPERLRANLRHIGQSWVSDPSNADPSALRSRLRSLRDDPDGDAFATRALVAASFCRGTARARREASWAKELGQAVRVHPQGWALCRADSLPAAAFTALVAMLAGAGRALPAASVAKHAAKLRPSTIGGVRIVSAGRLGPGWLLLREEAAMASPVAASAGAMWDGRFRVRPNAELPSICWMGAWADDAPRDRRGLPSVILRTLPVLRDPGGVIGYLPGFGSKSVPFIEHWPRHWAAGAPFSSLMEIE